MAAAPRLNPIRFPIRTLLLCAAAGAVFAAPTLETLLIYNRAAIGDGELWRLVTGSLVHFSPSHFAFNIVPLFIAGALTETLRYRHFARLCLVSGALVGLTLYLAKPEVLVFGGLSGVVTAAVTFLCLHGLREGGAWRRLCGIGLTCIAAKVAVELILGPSLLAFLGAEEQDFVPLPFSHAVGAVTAVLLFVATQPGFGHLVDRPPEMPAPPSFPSSR